jgi:hypothetical protein
MLVLEFFLQFFVLFENILGLQKAIQQKKKHLKELLWRFKELKQFYSWLHAKVDVVLTGRGMPTVPPISPMLQNAYDILYFC